MTFAIQNIAAKDLNLLMGLRDALNRAYLLISRDLSVVGHIADDVGDGHLLGKAHGGGRKGDHLRATAAPL